MQSRGRKWWLCVAPAVVGALDAGLTLAYQPAAHWAGQFDAVNEISPIDRWMLARRPLVFGAWDAVKNFLLRPLVCIMTPGAYHHRGEAIPAAGGRK